MKVYLAARYSRLDEINTYRADLANLGFTVTSRWLEGNHQASNDDLANGADAERFAQEDWNDLMDAELVISFTEPPRSSNSRGGRHVEFGAARAAGMTMIVIGPRENVFHCLPGVAVFQDWRTFADALNDALFVYQPDRSAILRDAVEHVLEGAG